LDRFHSHISKCIVIIVLIMMIFACMFFFGREPISENKPLVSDGFHRGTPVYKAECIVLPVYRPSKPVYMILQNVPSNAIFVMVGLILGLFLFRKIIAYIRFIKICSFALHLYTSIVSLFFGGHAPPFTFC